MYMYMYMETSNIEYYMETVQIAVVNIFHFFYAYSEYCIDNHMT